MKFFYQGVNSEINFLANLIYKNIISLFLKEEA